MSVFTFIIFVIVFFILLKIYLKTQSKWCRSKTCLVGKTVIVTGANTGIGYETALDFATRGAKVILGCRNEEKANEARGKIIRETQNPNVHVRLIDMSSLKSVRNFVENILATEERLDILVNNAGMAAAKNKPTEDGFKMLLQCNYLGSFLLTILLIDLLKKSNPSRVVNVSSIMARYAKLDLTNLNTYPGPYQDYNRTKLLNILFTIRLGELLKSSNVSVFSLHPGAIRTDIFRSFKGVRATIMSFVKLFFKTPEEGAQTTLHASLEPGLEQYSGGHFVECEYVKPYSTAQDPNLSKLAWEKTVELLNCQKDIERVFDSLK